MIDDSFAILLSIQPTFTEKILSRDKTIELRRRIGKKFVKGFPILIYSTSPKKALVGIAYIESIEKLLVDEIMEQKLEKACISKEACLSYFSGCVFGYAITLTEVEPLKKQISLDELRKLGLSPPQSFSYVSSEFLKKLRI